MNTVILKIAVIENGLRYHDLVRESSHLFGKADDIYTIVAMALRLGAHLASTSGRNAHG